MTPEAIKQVSEALRRVSIMPVLFNQDSQTKRMCAESLALLAAEQAKAPPDRERLAKVAENAAEWFRTNAIHSDYIAPLWEAAAALRLSPVTAGEWQDISTAPKDGSEILLLTNVGLVSARYHPADGWTDSPVTGRDYSGSWWICYDDAFQIYIEETPIGELSSATYWMPLPPSPKEAGR